MKDLSPSTKLYLCLTYMAGISVFVWHMSKIDLSNPWMLGVLCLLASLALILKVEGATNRSHYTLSFLIYGFTFALYGIPEAMLVIIVSSFAEWIWNKPAWYIQLFNAGCYILVMEAAGLVYFWINPHNMSISWQAALAIAAAMATFNLLNHLMVGIVLWLARGENFRRSGVFDFFPLMLDLTLLYFGAGLSLVWMYNHFALVLFLVPIYLIYSTLRVPALERQTEIDHKTGLFNHEYFKQHVDSELNRANRFDRPLTIIMADLDLLRNINNTYGHLAGDEVLIGVAKILKKSVREYDVAARFGGEEFAILLPETTMEQAYERAESIRKTIEEMEFTIPTSVSPIRATMSFGIACRESFGQTMNEIIHNADTALYHSKLSGRNRACAYANEAYLEVFQTQSQDNTGRNSVVEAAESPSQRLEPNLEKSIPGESRGSVHEDELEKPESRPDPDKSSVPARPTRSKAMVNYYIGLLTITSLLFFAATYQATMPVLPPISSPLWLSLLVISTLIATSEWYSVNLYFRQTAISTSAIPILVGYLLFGLPGTLFVSLAVAAALFVKYRSPISRFFFNFSNHMLAGTLCTFLIFYTGKQFLELSTFNQILLSLISAAVMYLITTWLIAVGMSLDLQQPAPQIWKEQYSWLAMYYMGIGLIAYTLIIGYKYDHNSGILLMVIPMVFLRLSQKQYVAHTRKAVIELREKNQSLKQSSDEIAELNEGLLETLSEIIDLRDPSVLGHSKQVSSYAVAIARSMKLNAKQVELIRKGALLHDIGKLGIPEHLLAKPSRLTVDEYEVIKHHALLGAELLEKSPSLRPLLPIVRHHHEHFNGNGYPDKLKGNQINIEARIVAIADAIDAMSSDRPYRKALSPMSMVDELKKHAGSQFDPLIVDKVLKMVEFQDKLREPNSEIQPNLMQNFTIGLPPS
jgi:diguanylate cyclase (GGDEF)-like protein/putative nucleotidyltransferase with HDIG domain